MSPIAELLGAELLSKTGVVSTEAALAEKRVVGLYFSAHWCPPCKMYTPQLGTKYEEYKKEGKSFEVVFVSSDRDEDSFNSYYGSQASWLALPFEERAIKEKLSKLYKVRGIPTLVLLDGATGEVITTKGREAVMDGEAYPWVPPTLSELLSGPLQTKAGPDTSVAELKAQGVTHLFLYFSAHWCPPCRQFTPVLASVYNKLKEKKVKMEGIFVSSDRDEASFNEYWGGEHPWLALKFSERGAKEKLSDHFGIEGIPSLVTLEICGDGSLAVVNADARGLVGGDPEGANFPWPPPLVVDFDEDPSSLNDTPSLVVLAEKAEGQWDDIEAALAEVQKERKAAAAPLVAMGLCKEIGGGISAQIRKLTKVGGPKPKPDAVLLDLSDDGTFYAGPSDFSADAVRAFLEQYKAGSLPKLSVK